MAKTTPTSQANAPKPAGQLRFSEGPPAPIGPPVAAPQTAKPPKRRSGAREKRELVWHPDLKVDPATGEPTAKLKAIPADYKTTVHKQLNIKHFETPEVFYELMARRYEEKAKAMRDAAAQAKQLGNIPAEAKADAKKIQNLVKRLDDLKADMAGRGVDVEAMLKLLAEQQAKKAAEKKEETVTLTAA